MCCTLVHMQLNGVMTLGRNIQAAFHIFFLTLSHFGIFYPLFWAYFYSKKWDLIFTIFWTNSSWDFWKLEPTIIKIFVVSWKYFQQKKSFSEDIMEQTESLLGTLASDVEMVWRKKCFEIFVDLDFCENHCRLPPWF